MAKSSNRGLHSDWGSGKATRNRGKHMQPADSGGRGKPTPARCNVPRLLITIAVFAAWFSFLLYVALFG